jgi:hypothetical protein
MSKRSNEGQAHRKTFKRRASSAVETEYKLNDLRRIIIDSERAADRNETEVEVALQRQTGHPNSAYDLQEVAKCFICVLLKHIQKTNIFSLLQLLQAKKQVKVVDKLTRHHQEMQTLNSSIYLLKNLWYVSIKQ